MKLIEKFVRSQYDSDWGKLQLVLRRKPDDVATGQVKRYGFSPLSKSSWKGRLISLLDLPSQAVKSTLAVGAMPFTLVGGAVSIIVGKILGLVIKQPTQSDESLERGPDLQAGRESPKQHSISEQMVNKGKSLIKKNAELLVKSPILFGADLLGLIVPDLAAQARQSKLNPLRKPPCMNLT